MRTLRPCGFVVDLAQVKADGVLVFEALITHRTLRVLTSSFVHLADMLPQALHVLTDQIAILALEAFGNGEATFGTVLLQESLEVIF